MIMAKSFLRGLMIGSMKLSLFVYSLCIVVFALCWFLHTKGIDWMEPKKVPGNVPGSMVPEKLTRLSPFSILNYMCLAFYFLYFARICFKFQHFLEMKEWGNGNVEQLGRRFYYMFSMFPVHLLFRVIYEMQINCGCEDDEVIPYLKVLAAFTPLISNFILIISYGLICICFNCKTDENTQMSALYPTLPTLYF